MLAARGEHQQRFRLEIHRLVQQDLAQFLAELRAARLAGDDDLPAGRGQLALEAFAEPLQVGGLPRPVDAFERDEFTARHY